MDTLVHTINQRIVEIVDFNGEPALKRAKTVLSAGKGISNSLIMKICESELCPYDFF